MCAPPSGSPTCGETKSNPRYPPARPAPSWSGARGNSTCVPRRISSSGRRRIKKGQFYHQPCFGCREFPAQFKWCEALPPCPEELEGERDLGWMLYDMDYTDPEDIRPLFFRAVLRDGVLNVPIRDSGEVRG